MKRRFLLLILASISTAVCGQGTCLTDVQSQRASIQEPEYAIGLQQMQTMMEEFAIDSQLDSGNREGFKEVVIPVVVHVLYREEVNNVSTDQIASQIEVLNRDFNAANPDREKIPDVWRGLSTSAQFTFKLADRDPDGNFTNGITRTQTTVRNIGTEELYHLRNRGGVNPWNTVHYLNIWVCELEGNALGFAILPGATMSKRDGIVISPRAFGTSGTAKAPYNQGRTLVHEVGHYFGLRHLWGDDNEVCSSTDYIDDTPNQRSENFGCATYPTISCGNGPHGDMFMNYMDYGNDTCALLFTKRQVEFMQLVLKTNRRALFHSSGVTGSAEVKHGTLSVFPNPTSGAFTVNFGNNVPRQVVITNVLGVIVKTFQSTAIQEVIHLNDVRNGVYFLTANNDRVTLIVR